MAEKPILFYTDMVKAILEGRKTQTRRVIKPQPLKPVLMGLVEASIHNSDIGKFCFGDTEIGGLGCEYFKPPYKVGDTLWVRETWCRDDITPEDIYYRANYTDSQAKELFSNNDLQWKPSIHMPRSAARLFLKIIDIRVERLQDISIEDIGKEGLEVELREFKNQFDKFGKAITNSNAIREFEILWNSTIKKQDIEHYGWNSNPWVWVIEFERLTNK